MHSWNSEFIPQILFIDEMTLNSIFSTILLAKIYKIYGTVVTVLSEIEGNSGKNIFNQRLSNKNKKYQELDGNLIINNSFEFWSKCYIIESTNQSQNLTTFFAKQSVVWSEYRIKFVPKKSFYIFYCISSHVLKELILKNVSVLPVLSTFWLYCYLTNNILKTIEWF